MRLSQLIKKNSGASSVSSVGGIEIGGYYAWRKREASQRKREDEFLGELIEDAHQNNRNVYGSPRIHAELKEQGVHCSRKRVARLMRERGINAKPKRRICENHR
jgi:putative transposase